MGYHICTYFDSNYIFQGMTLFRSLKKNADRPFRLYVACLDERCYEILTGLSDETLVPIRLSDIESFDPEFRACRANRSKIEYYFTLSPILPLYLFAKFPEIDILAYSDSDLYFYSSPQPIYDELGNNSLLIFEHRFPDFLKYREKFGIYNVAFQLYRRDAIGMSCLNWWRSSCINWCHDRCEDGKFADQKYLEKWPEMFPSLTVCNHPGAGLAPWNWSRFNLEIQNDGQMTVDCRPLIFYHFQGFRILTRFLLQHNLGSYHRIMPKQIMRWLYGGYCREIVATAVWIKQYANVDALSIFSKNTRAGFSFLRCVASGIKHRGLMLISPLKP